MLCFVISVKEQEGKTLSTRMACLQLTLLCKLAVQPHYSKKWIMASKNSRLPMLCSAISVEKQEERTVLTSLGLAVQPQNNTKVIMASDIMLSHFGFKQSVMKAFSRFPQKYWDNTTRSGEILALKGLKGDSTLPKEKHSPWRHFGQTCTAKPPLMTRLAKPNFTPFPSKLSWAQWPVVHRET